MIARWVIADSSCTRLDVTLLALDSHRSQSGGSR